jgi:hypothetical protein
VIVIAERDEAEGLQGSVVGGANRIKHFSHPSDRTTLDIEGNLDKITLAQRSGKPQQAAGDGNSLEFCLGALPVFEQD